MTRHNWRLAGLTFTLLTCSLYAQDEKPAPKRAPVRPVPSAQPAKEGQPKAKSPSTAASAQMQPTQATFEMIMNEAVKNIAKRYNLNEAQKQKTDEIMKRDVNKFLKEHEEQVWPIIRDLMANGFQPPSNPEDLKRIGQAAAPLVKKAQKAILDGNEEWRQYLTPEQKKMHDFDLAEMDKQFTEAEKNIKGWTEGKAGGGLFPQPSMAKSPPTPSLPAPGLPKQAPPPEPELEIFVKDSIFDTYVADFIKQYELDPAQIDAARSILAEFKLKAADFKESNRAELTRIATENKAAMESKDRERIAKAEAERKKLLEPAYVLFGQMDERLKALLTSSQLERYSSKKPEGQKKVDPFTEPSTAQAAPPPSPPARAADKSKAETAPAPKPEQPASKSEP